MFSLLNYFGSYFKRSKHFLTTNCKSSKQTDRHQTIEAPWQIYCYSQNWPLRIPMKFEGGGEREGRKTHHSQLAHCSLSSISLVSNLNWWVLNSAIVSFLPPRLNSHYQQHPQQWARRTPECGGKMKPGGKKNLHKAKREEIRRRARNPNPNPKRVSCVWNR